MSHLSFLTVCYIGLLPLSINQAAMRGKLAQSWFGLLSLLACYLIGSTAAFQPASFVKNIRSPWGGSIISRRVKDGALITGQQHGGGGMMMTMEPVGLIQSR